MEQIPRDDWTDQDLLTREEAAARLTEELAELDRALGDPATDPALRLELQQRRDVVAAAVPAITGE